jgi:hypothetical protein
MQGSIDFWAPLFAGIGLIVVGATQLLKYRDFRSRAERVPGVVVDMSESLMGQYHSTRYHPVLEFTTRGGRRVRTTMQAGSRPAPAQVGDSVVVAYDPDEPEAAEISGKGWIRVLVLVALMLAGCLFVLLAWL